MYKPKVLWVGEASYLNTGYSRIGFEILQRLYNTGKWNISEFSSYGDYEEAFKNGIPWKFYPNLPNKNNKQEVDTYLAKPTNQFGEWRFEEVCLDFEPDIVISITDPWMHEYQFLSPYRRLYNQVVMPTVDSDPQQPAWIAMYMGADRVAAYSAYGKRILEEQSNGKISVFDVLRPGFDDQNFKVLPNKQEIRQSLLMPVPKDAFVIGTVMRNQKRKLYDDLFLSFKTFCEKYPRIGENSFLYCHTSIIDNGWDIPRLLKEHGIANKVLFSYVCRNCHNIISSYFNNTNRFCPFCGGQMTSPNTRYGANNEQLGRIYNTFNIYVQYSIAEGAAIPPVEAAACGIPVLEVDFSAMEDYVRCLGGVPINVLKKFRETETHCYRVYPDNNHLIEILHQIAIMPEIDRHIWSLKTKALANKYFNWDDVAEKWSIMLDSLQIAGSRWHSQPFIHQPNLNIPQQISNTNFIDHAIANITGRTDLINTYFAIKILRDLNAGAKIQGFGGNLSYNDDSMFSQNFGFKPYSREDMVNELLRMNNNTNEWEQKRLAKMNGQYKKPEWIL
jgi:glycosyltransferase involved in cell wall biosynthesis